MINFFLRRDTLKGKNRCSLNPTLFSFFLFFFYAVFVDNCLLPNYTAFFFFYFYQRLFPFRVPSLNNWNYRTRFFKKTRGGHRYSPIKICGHFQENQCWFLSRNDLSARVVNFELIIKRNEKKIYDIIKRDIAFLRLQIFLLTRCQCQYLLAG